jgi:hypothetical protein
MASEKRHDYPSILPITKEAREKHLLSLKKPGTTPKTKNSRARGSSGISLTGPTPIASVGAPPKYNNLS